MISPARHEQVEDPNALPGHARPYACNATNNTLTKALLKPSQGFDNCSNVHCIHARPTSNLRLPAMHSVIGTGVWFDGP